MLMVLVGVLFLLKACINFVLCFTEILREIIFQASSSKKSIPHPAQCSGKKQFFFRSI